MRPVTGSVIPQSSRPIGESAVTSGRHRSDRRRRRPAAPRSEQTRPSSAVVGPPSVSVGSRLDGRYQLQEVLGDGGSATVFGGTDTVLDRPVAVKVFHSRVDSTTQARRRREINLAADFVHPHLVAVYDAHLGSDDRSGRTPGAPSYLVTEYVDGQTLARRLDGPPLTHSEVAQIGIGLARALAVLHRSGVVHRDVKPGNILLEARTGQVKLGDFGIARDLGEDPVTRTADVVGTAPYLSPEQARGDPVGCPSDVYSLGLVLLECLTGHREYAGTPVEAAVARLVRDPEVPPDLPTPWPTLLRRMTSRDTAHRPAADEVAAILAHHHHATEAPAAASETSRGRTVPTPERGRRRPTGLGHGSWRRPPGQRLPSRPAS